MNENIKDFFIIDPEWIEKYPGAKAGILVMKHIDSTGSDSSLKEIAKEIEDNLKKDFKGFGRENINNIPTIKFYNNYYKNFSKTYHVRSQVESILNGKSLSSGSRIVTAMFMAEVKNMLLTAGHDMSAIEIPIHITIGTTQEKFIDIRGVEKSTIEGDMIMIDGKGVISSILLGPDARTKLTPTTRDVLFAVYAPAEVGFEATFSHLKDIENYVKVFSPEAETEILEVFEAR